MTEDRAATVRERIDIRVSECRASVDQDTRASGSRFTQTDTELYFNHEFIFCRINGKGGKLDGINPCDGNLKSKPKLKKEI